MNNPQVVQAGDQESKCIQNCAFARLWLRWCDARTLTRGIRSTLKVMRIRCDRHTFAAPFPVWSALTARCDGPIKKKEGNVLDSKVLDSSAKFS